MTRNQKAGTALGIITVWFMARVALQLVIEHTGGAYALVPKIVFLCCLVLSLVLIAD